MEQYQKLLLEVWREACRHIEINESLARIAALLSDATPVETLVLYFIDPAGPRMEQLSYISIIGDGTSPNPPSFEAGQIDEILSWCRRGEVESCSKSETPSLLPPELFAGLGRFRLALPLASEHDMMGLLLMANAARPFSHKEEQLARLLRESFTVALENDRRLHQLVALREAAEADKRKLLHRLGRERLSNEIVGEDGGLRMVMQRVELVSHTDAPVLIFGETGSGKEVIARAIHNRSFRSSAPFIRVNCGAIPPELIDSELFGHERGSFTGAVTMRRGWFERADGGTLLLDEIAELPPAAQVRLLRVLQDSRFERVGGEKALHVNVRIITATHRDLARMVQEKAFREDLWYRIAVFPIVLPPLRERRQDIPALSRHFAERAARRFGLKIQHPNPEEIALLTEYNWPGNVRELAAVLDRAAILGDGKRLEVAKSLGSTIIGPEAEKSPPPGDAPGKTTPKTLDQAMRAHIEQALVKCHGKIEGPDGAAELLDINPHTLRARMRKLNINWAKFR